MPGPPPLVPVRCPASGDERHLAVLQEADMVTLAKEGGRRPVTICRLTSLGRLRFADYLDVLERLVRDAREDALPLGRLSQA